MCKPPGRPDNAAATASAPNEGDGTEPAPAEERPGDATGREVVETESGRWEREDPAAVAAAAGVAREYEYRTEGVAAGEVPPPVAGKYEAVDELDVALVVLEPVPKRDEEVEACEGRAAGLRLNGLNDHVEPAEVGL